MTRSTSGLAIAALLLVVTATEGGPPAATIPPAQGIHIAASAITSALGQARSRRSKRRRMTYSVVAVTGGTTIEGVVRFEGTVPPPRKVQIVKDQEHCGHRPTSVPAIKINEDKAVAEAVVFLADIKRGRGFDKLDAKPKIDQKACTYHPHVQVIPVRQAFDVVNSDPVLHNIQAVQGTREPFNFAQPKQGMVQEQSFSKGGLVILNCQAHQWMRAYVYVAWHPYFAVTDAAGRFRLADVPPGEYELAVWQETLGEQSRPVNAEAGKTAKVEFLLKPKDNRAARAP